MEFQLCAFADEAGSRLSEQIAAMKKIRSHTLRSAAWTA